MPPFAEFVMWVIGTAVLAAFFLHGQIKDRSYLTIIGDHLPQKGWFPLYEFLGTLIFVGVWGILTNSGLISNSLIPTPTSVFVTLIDLFFQRNILWDISVSIGRVAGGFGMAAIVGVGLGIAVGSYLVMNRLLQPVLSFFRYIPPSAFIFLLIIYFGVGETYKFSLIFVGIIFFITQMTIDAVEDTDIAYIEMAGVAGLGRMQIIRRVVIPFSGPRILDVLRINLAAAWTFLVLAEMIGANSGLGHFMAVSQRFLRIEDLYAGIILFGIVGIVTDRSLAGLSRYMFPWFYLKEKRDYEANRDN